MVGAKITLSSKGLEFFFITLRRFNVCHLMLLILGTTHIVFPSIYFTLLRCEFFKTDRLNIHFYIIFLAFAVEMA